MPPFRSRIILLIELGTKTSRYKVHRPPIRFEDRLAHYRVHGPSLARRFGIELGAKLDGKKSTGVHSASKIILRRIEIDIARLLRFKAQKPRALFENKCWY